jgi:transcription antitermination factor NusG
MANVEYAGSGTGGPRWYACWTRSRHEKRVHQMLGERGIESFLPLVLRERRWSDRRAQVEFPLFPSYVFARFDVLEAGDVLRIPGVAGLVSSNGRPAPIDDAELDNVREFTARLRDGVVTAEPCPYFAAGSDVEVTAGPLMGLRGRVTGHRGRTRVVIGLAAIGQGMAVEIDSRHLAAVTGSGT